MKTKRYQVIDIQTKDVMGSYDTRKQASRRADKLDLQHGAIRYAVNDTEFFNRFIADALANTKALNE